MPAGAPVRRVGRHEPQRQAGQREQRDRRAERGERGRQQQQHDRLQLDRPAVRRLGEQRGRPRTTGPAADDAAVLPEVVGVVRVEVRDDHGDREHRPEQAPRRQGQPGATPARSQPAAAARPTPAARPPRATGPGSTAGYTRRSRAAGRSPATVNPWASSTNTSGIAQQIAAAGAARTRADSENAISGTASAISWKSKTIICCRPQEKPYAKPISRPVAAPEQRDARRGHREHRHRGGQRLADQQRGGRREQPEERRDHRDGDLEVVAEQVESGRRARRRPARANGPAA